MSCTTGTSWSSGTVRHSRSTRAPQGGLVHRSSANGPRSERALQSGPMGIRYYAYAFDAGMTEQASADPRSVIRADPLADAWGLQPGFSSGFTDFTSSLAQRDFLYLDKAWRYLQQLTAPLHRDDPPRPAFGMFAGAVRETGSGWIPWTSALAPADVGGIAEDLRTLDRSAVESLLRGCRASRSEARSEVDYVTTHLEAAKRFADGLALDGRGFAYLIG